MGRRLLAPRFRAPSLMSYRRNADCKLFSPCHVSSRRHQGTSLLANLRPGAPETLRRPRSPSDDLHERSEGAWEGTFVGSVSLTHDLLRDPRPGSGCGGERQTTEAGENAPRPKGCGSLESALFPSSLCFNGAKHSETVFPRWQ